MGKIVCLKRFFVNALCCNYATVLKKDCQMRLFESSALEKKGEPWWTL